MSARNVLRGAQIKRKLRDASRRGLEGALTGRKVREVCARERRRVDPRRRQSPKHFPSRNTLGESARKPTPLSFV